MGFVRQTVIVQQIANASLVYNMTGLTFMILGLLAVLVANGLADQGSEDWAAGVYGGAGLGFLIGLALFAMAAGAKKQEQAALMGAQGGLPSGAPPTMAPPPAPPVAAPAAAAVQAPAPSAPLAPPPAPVPSNTCPRCGRPTAWVAQYGKWFCPAEQQYI